MTRIRTIWPAVGAGFATEGGGKNDDVATIAGPRTAPPEIIFFGMATNLGAAGCPGGSCCKGTLVACIFIGEDTRSDIAAT